MPVFLKCSKSPDHYCEHGWIYYDFSNRTDNLVCVAIVDKESIIIKTVMINWQLRDK